jgi:hypothetical protein
VLMRNSASLRRDTLRRGRTRVFMSRRTLEQRYGRGASTRRKTSSRHQGLKAAAAATETPPRSID